MNMKKNKESLIHAREPEPDELVKYSFKKSIHNNDYTSQFKSEYEAVQDDILDYEFRETDDTNEFEEYDNNRAIPQGIITSR